jgi:hypothetical protein
MLPVANHAIETMKLGEENLNKVKSMMVFARELMLQKSDKNNERILKMYSNITASLTAMSERLEQAKLSLAKSYKELHAQNQNDPNLIHMKKLLGQLVNQSRRVDDLHARAIQDQFRIASRVPTTALNDKEYADYENAKLQKQLPKAPTLDPAVGEQMKTEQLLASAPRPETLDPRIGEIAANVRKVGWFLATRNLPLDDVFKVSAQIKSELAKETAAKRQLPSVPTHDPNNDEPAPKRRKM